MNHHHFASGQGGDDFFLTLDFLLPEAPPGNSA